MAGIEFWHWWALGGLLVIIEAFMPGFMFLWLGVAAGMVGLVLLAWPAIDPTIQLLIYAALAISSVTGWTWYRRMHPATTDHPTLNRRGTQYIGRSFSLVAPIVNGRGRIKLGDTSWTVAGPDLPAGRIVEVTGVDGTVLQVQPGAEGTRPESPADEGVQPNHA